MFESRKNAMVGWFRPEEFVDGGKLGLLVQARTTSGDEECGRTP